MNLRLFLLLIFIEFSSIIIGFFGLLLFFFLSFGSGASSSSDKAILTENIAVVILTLLPFIFGVFRYKTLEEKEIANSYLYSGLAVTIVSGIYFGFTY